MLPLLVPILAQAVSLTLGDRTEARYVDEDATRWEATTSPGAELALRLKRSDYSLSYSPELTITPLEHKPREKLVFHNLGANATYRFRLTTLTLNSTLGLGQINFRTAALRGPAGVTNGQVPDPADGQVTPDPADPTAPDPAQPDPTGGMPGANPNVDANGVPVQQGQTEIANRTVRYLTWNTTLSLSRQLSRQLSVGGYTGYSEQRGLDKASKLSYPKSRGISVGADVTHLYQLWKRDSFASSLSVEQAWSFDDTNVLSVVVREDWRHKIATGAASTLGGGLSVTRFSQRDGTVGISIFPTFNSGIGYSVKAAHGVLSMSTGAYAAPVLDPLRATVDPRLGVSGELGWIRESFSTSLSGDAAISVADSKTDDNAVNSFNASYIAAYGILEGLVVDVGARGTALSFGGTTTIPPSWAVFAGVGFGHAFMLIGGAK
jgi:hypothetical protein